MNTRVTLVRSSALVAGLALAGTLSAQNLLTNPDFAGNSNGWSTFGAVGYQDFFGSNLDATFYSDRPENIGFLWQDVPGIAGLEYTFTILGMRIENTTDAIISYGIEFRDANDTVISAPSATIDYALVSRNVSDYSPASVVSTAPIGTAVVRPIISFSGATFGANWFYVMNTELTAASPVPEPSSFAAIAGLGALGCVALRRRRRA